MFQSLLMYRFSSWLFGYDDDDYLSPNVCEINISKCPSSSSPVKVLLKIRRKNVIFLTSWLFITSSEVAESADKRVFTVIFRCDAESSEIIVKADFVVFCYFTKSLSKPILASDKCCHITFLGIHAFLKILDLVVDHFAVHVFKLL